MNRALWLGISDGKLMKKIKKSQKNLEIQKTQENKKSKKKLKTKRINLEKSKKI
jgi:hypothetical protein